MNKIIIIGPECSGKTTLANDLSNALNLPVIAEYARDYISEIKYKYQQSDLIKIARENQFDRDKIFQIYKCELQTLNHDYFIIKDQDRLVQAKKIIKNFIG